MLAAGRSLGGGGPSAGPEWRSRSGRRYGGVNRSRGRGDGRVCMAEPSSGRKRPIESEVAPSLAVRRLVHGFESVLWGSRLLVLVAVIVVLVLAVTALVLAAADAAYLVGKLAHFVGDGLSGQARNQRRTELITTVVKALDNCLIGALLIVVSLGLYELFISRIEPRVIA